MGLPAKFLFRLRNFMSIQHIPSSLSLFKFNADRALLVSISFGPLFDRGRSFTSLQC